MSRYLWHLIVLHPNGRAVGVIQTPGGWLLPYTHGQAFAESHDQLTALQALAGLSTCPIHDAPIVLNAGADEWHGYRLLACPAAALPANLQYVPSDMLSTSPPLLYVQHDVLTRCLRRVHAPSRAFDGLTALSPIVAWAAALLDTWPEELLRSAHCHGISRSHLTMRLERPQQRYFLKAGECDTAREAELTRALDAIAPRRFASVVGIDRARGCWLAEEMAGTPLAQLEPTSERVRTVVRTLATVQVASAVDETTRMLLSERALPPGEVGRRCVDLLVQLQDQLGLSASTLGVLQQRIGASCAVIASLGWPLGWVHADLWGANVLVNDRGIGFIDLEDSYWSTPVLALWRLIRNLQAPWTLDASARERLEAVIYDEYRTCWRRLVPVDQIEAAIAELPIMGRLLRLCVLQAHLDRACVEQDGELSPSQIQELYGPTIKGLLSAVLRVPHQR